MVPVARYDPHVDWYEEFRPSLAARLAIVGFEELGEREYPYSVAVGCRRDGTRKRG